MQVTRREICTAFVLLSWLKNSGQTEGTNFLLLFLKLKLFVLLLPIVRQVNVLLFLIVPQFHVLIEQFIKLTVYLLLDFDMLIIRSVWSHNSNDVHHHHTAHVFTKRCQSDRQQELRRCTLCTAAERRLSRRCVMVVCCGVNCATGEGRSFLPSPCYWFLLVTIHN